MLTHREKILKAYHLKDQPYSLMELSEITKVPVDILQKVYNRGIGAYSTQPLSVRMLGTFKKNVQAPMSRKLPKEMWAFARVYSFLDKNPNHDQDLQKLVK